MKKTLLIAVAILAIVLANGQVKKIIRVGLFTSLYLDSAFDATGAYRLQNNFPRMAIGGLEFYEGAVLALDSINQFETKAKMEVFDIQSKVGAIAAQAVNKKFDSLDLIIAQVGGAEYLQLAAIAKERNIPMVSASYPNDGGIREHPMVYIANPKINSHLQVIHNQVYKKWPEANIIWCKKKGLNDDKIESQFKALNAAYNGKNKIKTALLDPAFNTKELALLLDTNKTNVLIAGSLDDNFAIQLVKAVSSYPKKGILQVVGMPGWEGIKEFQGKTYAAVPIYYTTGFYLPAGHKWAAYLDEKVKSVIGVKPSISMYKGFELMFYFTNMFQKYGEFKPNAPDAISFKVLNDLDFRPVKWSPLSVVPDYHENKRIHFIRRLNGVATLQ